MNSMRNMFCVLMAIVLATLALPSVAGNDKKMFSANMAIVSSPPAVAPAPFTTLSKSVVSATITNKGNSTINSFNLFVTGLTIVEVAQPSNGNATFTGSSVSVKNMHPLKSGDSVTVRIGASSCGDGMWSAVAWTGSALNGQTFSIDLAPGHSVLETDITCGDPLGAGDGFTVPDSLAADCVIKGNRGVYDKDGTTPVDVSYFVTNTIPANGRVHFRWPVDNTGDPAAAFIYTITCPGAAPPQTNVAWFNTDGTPSTGTTGTPDFIHTFFDSEYEGDPLGCVPQNPDDPESEAILPVPYKTLASAVQPGDTYITVSSTNPADFIVPPATPFDVVIGSGLQTERLTVTGITCVDNGEDEGAPDLGECSEEEGGPPNIWFVTRGVGGTTAESHSASALVMYTPLPIMQITQGVAMPQPEYKAFNQAQMCVVSRSFDPESNKHSTTFIDIGDGHVGGP